MIECIVVATDGSQDAERAVELAADLASKYQARLSIVHVLLLGPVPPKIRALSDKPGGEQPPMALGGNYIDAELPREVRVDIAQTILAAARERAEAHGVRDIRAEWREGPTAERILDYAREHGADMIVMGSRGLGQLRGIMVGGVSHKVGHLYAGNVLTVRPSASQNG